jgi:tetratricopeptide (TPR) repeat protein
MAEGEFALVRQHLEAALNQNGEWIGKHDLYTMLADTAAQQHDLEALQQYTPLADETANRYQHPLYQAIVHRAWGVERRLEGDWSAAEERLGKAMAAFEELGARWQMGRTKADIGELYLGQGEVQLGRTRLKEALALFEEIGAVPDARRITSLLASSA